MAVFRVERNTGYTVMSNHHLRNKELSLKAKGLLSQMLSLPEDWDYTLAGLSHINREKIDAIREAVKELEKAGYIVRSRERDEKGRLRGADYVIYEQPQPREPEAATSGGQPPILDLPTLENPTLDNPTLEKPTQEKPTLENPTQLNKDISSKEQSITDLSSTHSIPFHSLNPLPFAQGEAATPPERKRTEAKSNNAVEIYREIIKDNGRMIEIYLVTSVAPIPMATMVNHEWGSMGQNYLKSLLALGFQAFLILVCVGIYAVLIQTIAATDDISGAIWACMVLAMLPMFLLAMYEKNGQPLEVIIRQFVEVKFLRPKERPYQTNNFYTALARQERLDKEVRAIVKGKGKDPKQKA